MVQPKEETLLRVEDVKRSFVSGDQTVEALKSVNLAVDNGQLVALKGRSGSGKTTLLNILAALDAPTEGQIFYEGRLLNDMGEVEKNELRRVEVGLIFQSFALVPYMSAYENVEFALRIAGWERTKRKERAEYVLALVGLKERMYHRPQELSGGEQQRTAIARAIAHKPKLVLADEPTSQLDSNTALQIVHLLRELVEQQGMSIVMTTHDEEVLPLVSVVYALEDGHIVASNE